MEFHRKKKQENTQDETRQNSLQSVDVSQSALAKAGSALQAALHKLAHSKVALGRVISCLVVICVVVGVVVGVLAAQGVDDYADADGAVTEASGSLVVESQNGGESLRTSGAGTEEPSASEELAADTKDAQTVAEGTAADETEETEEATEEEPVYDLTDTVVIPDVAYPYYIKVNRQANCVTVYVYDVDTGEYSIPVKAMVCSVGLNDKTPLGVFTTTDKYTWRALVGNVYGQYAFRITGSILFHSVPYDTTDKSTLETEEYNKLGEAASLGCVRMCCEDCKWLYDNCPSGTQVEIYDAEDPGPLGKPTAIRIDPSSPYANWDPTDPDPSNPWNRTVTGETTDSSTQQSDTQDTGTEEIDTQGSSTQEVDTQAANTSEYTYTAFTARTMYVAMDVNVRDLPSTDGTQIGHMTAGEAVTVTGQCNETGWYRIYYHGLTGYCSNNFLTDTNPNADTEQAESTQSSSSSATQDNRTWISMVSVRSSEITLVVGQEDEIEDLIRQNMVLPSGGHYELSIDSAELDDVIAKHHVGLTCTVTVTILDLNAGMTRDFTMQVKYSYS